MRTRGFTLLEVLIAMAIFAVIGLASNAILTSVLDSNQLSGERFDKLEKLQRAMLTLERDIEQAVPRSIRIQGESSGWCIKGGNGEFESDADGLGLVHSGWHNPQLMLPRSTLQPVAYRLREGKLQRVYSNYVDNVIGYEPKVRDLLDNIDDFQVRFYTSEEQPQETYTGTKLPKAVEITIQSQDFGELTRLLLLTAGAQ
ncbi:type II secretion system minor pseudopilin GspJ [Neptunicella marina]|uniref:Type II secretion system protein J n=1 Tax=Neptunicella marina TaxID=2125989 RepID=A0A8J6IT84_9ALTE|nr:type II secretion system minor pseudopilin GspJ [Neptunicella marina]MBC3765869.1 type II secretion system minor pseudopilin GspJ [Neptunicella marina]